MRTMWKSNETGGVHHQGGGCMMVDGWGLSEVVLWQKCVLFGEHCIALWDREKAAICYLIWQTIKENI